MPFYKGHTYWDDPRVRKTQFKNGQPSPRKGIKSNKPAWNKGLTGVMKPNKTSYKAGVTTGENHPQWKGGVSKVEKIVRRMKENLQWRSDVFARDKWTCMDCGANKCYLTAHHIKSFASIIAEYNIKKTSDARKCKELWDISNGKTLCEPCHENTDNYRSKGRKVKNGANSVKLSGETIPSQQER